MIFPVFNLLDYLLDLWVLVALLIFYLSEKLTLNLCIIQSMCVFVGFFVCTGGDNITLGFPNPSVCFTLLFFVFSLYVYSMFCNVFTLAFTCVLIPPIPFPLLYLIRLIFLFQRDRFMNFSRVFVWKWMDLFVVPHCI